MKQKQPGRRCCGMDVHKDSIVVCVLPPDRGEGSVLRGTDRSFRNDLIRMRTWLKQLKVTGIAMESTGIYWRPVWNVLEEQGFSLLLVNPAQVTALAGRKSDGRDCRRIAEFLEDGRLDASFVPPEILSWKVKGRLRAKGKEVKESLKACFSVFRRGMLETFYEHYRFLTSQIEKFEARIAERTPHEERIGLLTGIPGVGRIVGWHLIAEPGTDMSVFPGAGHCASWAGLVPG
jgi:transposase